MPSAPVRQPTAAKSRPASLPAGLQLAPATVSQTQTLSIDEKMRRAEEAECRAKSTCSNHTTEPADDATDDATEPSSAEFGGRVAHDSGCSKMLLMAHTTWNCEGLRGGTIARLQGAGVCWLVFVLQVCRHRWLNFGLQVAGIAGWI